MLAGSGLSLIGKPLLRFLTPTGGANIKIIFRMIDRAHSLDGDLADCDVFRAASLIALATYLRQRAIAKTVYSFDSFQGFDEAVRAERKFMGGFSGTSFELVRRKATRFGLEHLLSAGVFQRLLRAAAPGFMILLRAPRRQSLRFLQRMHAFRLPPA